MMDSTQTDRMLAEEGARNIEWAKQGMPVLKVIEDRLKKSGLLAGVHVGVGLVLEPKTANLALALKNAGASVSVYCQGSSTTQSVVEALRAEGLKVFAEEGCDADRDVQLAREYLQTKLDIIIDDGASVIRLAHKEFPELVESMLGAAEETTSGVRPLRMMHEDGQLRIPVISVNDAETKYLFDNVYGTGQSCVMAMLDITNLQLSGRYVVVVGYGWVGRGIAKYAAAMGARVIVTEIDPIKALQAVHDGYRVQSLAEAAPIAEVIFSATGIRGAVAPAILELLPDGAILCTAGGGPYELPMAALQALGTEKIVRQSVAEYVMPSGKTVLVLGEGDCINCSDAEGNPIEIMDLSLSLQALAVEQIITEAHKWEPGVYPISTESEQEVARIRLEHEGASLEPLTTELTAAIRSW